MQNKGRALLLLIVLVAALLLAGCVSDPKVHEGREGFSYTVSKAYRLEGQRVRDVHCTGPDEKFVLIVGADTVTRNGEVYEFSLSARTRSAYSMLINYPDGYQYTADSDGMVTSSNAMFVRSKGRESREGFDVFELDPQYPKPEILADAILLANAPEKERNPLLYLMLLVLVGVGLFALIKPEASWRHSIGWQFRNAEPSDVALIWQRVGGVIMIIMAIVLLARAV